MKPLLLPRTHIAPSTAIRMPRTGALSLLIFFSALIPFAGAPEASAAVPRTMTPGRRRKAVGHVRNHVVGRGCWRGGGTDDGVPPASSRVSSDGIAAPPLNRATKGDHTPKRTSAPGPKQPTAAGRERPQGFGMTAIF